LGRSELYNYLLRAATIRRDRAGKGCRARSLAIFQQAMIFPNSINGAQWPEVIKILKWVSGRRKYV